MIRQRIKISILRIAVVVLIAAAGASPASAEKPMLFIDGFEAHDAPWVKWSEILGCPGLEIQAPIAGLQSLRLATRDLDCGNIREPDLICGNLGGVDSATASFWVDLRDLSLADGSRFEIFGLIKELEPSRRALAVKMEQSEDQLLVHIEAMEDDSNIVVSPQYSVADLMQRGTRLHFTLDWNRSPASSDQGSAILLVEGGSSTLNFGLISLENSTLEPDYVRVGFGESELVGTSNGSLLLDDFRFSGTSGPSIGPGH